MKKGIISLAIVLAMVVSMFVPAFAEDAAAVAPLVIDFKNGDTIATYPEVGSLVDGGFTDGTSGYNETEEAWEYKVKADGVSGANTMVRIYTPESVRGLASGYNYIVATVKIEQGEGATGAQARFVRYGSTLGYVLAEDDQVQNTIESDEWTTIVMQGTASGGILQSHDLYIYAPTDASAVPGGTTVYIKSIAYFGDKNEALAFDIDEYRAANAPVPPSEPVTDIYFDNNLFYEDVENNAYASEDGASIIIDKTFTELGGIHCTTHVTDYWEGCLIDEDFCGDEFYNYFIKCQATKNSKYVDVKAEYVADFDGEEGEGTEGGIRFTVKPLDNYIAKDIEIEVQMYVIRNDAQQAHRSNTVKFELEILNRYIDDDDIAAIAGEDCSLFIDETAYVVKGSQFEEAGDKSVSIAWWNAETPDINDFVINFESVVGQNGINFGWAKVEDKDLPASVTGLSKLAHWAGIAFGSEEELVNGATVSVYNNFGAGFKYAYTLDAEGNLTYVGEAKFEEYAEFEVEAGEALGTFLFSNQKFETAPVEPEEPDEDDKEAPGTGAGANMMGLAVFAVVALAGAAVVASKK